MPLLFQLERLPQSIKMSVWSLI
uniref:Uncharacterized protein n=1 Tax=Anguilla anguilla TaxID=7936 RepID=A0A0E9PH90_ANGAN